MFLGVIFVFVLEKEGIVIRFIKLYTNYDMHVYMKRE